MQAKAYGASAFRILPNLMTVTGPFVHRPTPRRHLTPTAGREARQVLAALAPQAGLERPVGTEVLVAAEAAQVLAAAQGLRGLAALLGSVPISTMGVKKAAVPRLRVSRWRSRNRLP